MTQAVNRMNDLKIIGGILLAVAVTYSAVHFAGAGGSDSGAAVKKAEESASGMNVQQLIDTGNHLMDQGRFEQAAAHYTGALMVDSSLTNVRIDRGSCFYALGAYDSAIADFRRAISAEPDHATAYFNLGIAYGAIGEDSLMSWSWGKYLELEPDGEMADKVRQFLLEEAESGKSPESGNL
jgi:tetratricopeptide (TPR) repeat protein